MKKNISRNPLWPDWYNGKKIDEVQFGRAFLEQWPLKCVNGTLYTLDGPVEDESEIKQRILENIEEYVTSGLSKKVTNILETIKLLAFSDPFPIEQDCIHLQNGVYHLPDGSFQESRLFCQNRLPVKYDPKAPSPDRWLTFLHELLDDADIPTLQEYLGYCLIPSTKGQKMMLIVGKGGEGKSRIGLVLKRLMGDAASNGSVQKVENNRFARADLERRLLMIDDDMDMNALPKTNYIKTIVTAEAKLDLERKGVQSYQRDIYARFLCFGNGALTSLVALDTLALQVQLGLGGHDGLDIIGLGQGVHIHIIVDHQQAAFQIGTGKAVVLDFLDAAVAGGISHEPLEHQPDAGLALAALADNEHHLLPFGAGDQAVAQILLQGGDVGIVQQLVQES